MICGNNSIVHRNGSGLATLRGLTCGQCRARFLATFSGNIAIPTGGTAGPIQLAITLDGEPLGSAVMISTPAAAEEFNNVSASAFIDIPKGCCGTLSVRNTSTVAIDVANANLIVTREA